MSQAPTAWPRISVLSQAQLRRVHAASLEILSSVGVRVDSERARQVFAQAIGKPADGDRVRIPRELVERALDSAPGPAAEHQISG